MAKHLLSADLVFRVAIFLPHPNPARREMVRALVYRGRNSGSERWGHLPGLTQLTYGRVGACTHIGLTPKPLLVTVTQWCFLHGKEGREEEREGGRKEGRERKKERGKERKREEKKRKEKKKELEQGHAHPGLVPLPHPSAPPPPSAKEEQPVLSLLSGYR